MIDPGGYVNESSILTFVWTEQRLKVHFLKSTKGSFILHSHNKETTLKQENFIPNTLKQEITSFNIT